MKPSSALALKTEAVRNTVAHFRVANPRVFGSVAAGTDRDGSDLDLLVDALPGATLFDLGALQAELEDILGLRVDVLTSGDLPARCRDQVLSEARPLRHRPVPRISSDTCAAAEDAMSFVEGLERADFLDDKRTQQAVRAS